MSAPKSKTLSHALKKSISIPLRLLFGSYLVLQHSKPCSCRKMGCEKVVTSQVSGELRGWATMWGSLALLKEEFESQPQ